MSGSQKVIIAGYLSKDVDTRYLPSGQAVANFSIPVSRKWKDKDSGNDMEETEWMNIVAFGKRAEAIAKYCSKGSCLYVEARAKTERWKDQSGNEKQLTKYVLEAFSFLGGRDSQNSNGGQSQQNKSSNQQPQQNNSGFDDFDDDIPF